MPTDFIVKDDLGFASQLKNLASKLQQYQAVLQLTGEEAQEAIDNAAYFSWVQEQVLAHTERRKNWNAYRDLLRNPGTGIPPINTSPETLIVTPPPAVVAMGIEPWFRKLARRIKGAKQYTEAIGLDLGIVATNTEANQRVAARKPVFTVELVAGQPLIKWIKAGMDGVEIWKDSGDGNFSQLLFDQRPNHLDTSELPKPGTTAVWKYKLIYRYKDERIGEWSDVATILVAGAV